MANEPASPAAGLALDRASGKLVLRLLGRLEARLASGEECPIPGSKAQALLGYLAVRLGEREHRDRLATLLWADRGQEQARHSLRQALLVLRRSLPTAEREVLGSDGQTLWLDPMVVTTDLAQLQSLSGAGDIASLQAATELLGGELLEGLPQQSEPYGEWLDAERARLRQRHVELLLRLAQALLQAAQQEAAIAAARRALQVDPALEEAHRLLMELHRRAGNRTAALRQYQLCVAALRQEVDAEPEQATRQLAERIRREDSAAAPAAPERSTIEASPVTAAAAPPTAPAPPAARSRGWWRWAAPGAAAALLAIGGLVALRGTDPPIAPSPAVPAAPAPPFVLAAPERPSIVILPFRNSTGDAAHQPLVDGITEEVTAALTMVSGMFVISRITALTYRDRPVDLREVARDLGVRYVLDGAVLVEGGTVRLIAHLSDAAENRLVWTHRQEDRMSGIFQMTDAITLEILTGLNVQLTEGEQERVSLIHGTRNLQAWLLAGKALQHVRRFTRSDNLEARRLYELALAQDPAYSGATNGLAWTYFVEGRFGWAPDPAEALLRAAAIAQQTLERSPTHPASFALLGGVALALGQHQEAVRLAERAVALSPSGADVTAVLGLVLTYAGNPQRAAETMQRAMKLSPYYPDWYRWTLGRAWRLAGEPQRALAALESVDREREASIAPLIELVAAYAAAGREGEARAVASRVDTIAPSFSIDAWLRVPPYADAATREAERRLLRQAGLRD